MSSKRSQIRYQPPSQAPYESVPDSQRLKQSSRIPTRQISMDSSKPSSLLQPTSSSRLARRSSRSIGSATMSSAAGHSPAMSHDQGSSSALSPPTSYRLSMLPPPGVIRTPSLVSGSSVSTFDSPRSSALRRKPSSAIDQYAAQKRADHSPLDHDRIAMHSRSDTYAEDLDDTVLGILPMDAYNSRSGDIIIGHQQNSPLDDQPPVSFNVTPPVPMYPPSATPSTRYTDSPFSHAPTPSSVSSYSSGIVATSSAASSRNISSPSKHRSSFGSRSTARDPAGGLAPVRESSTSSSNKTVRPADNKSAATKGASKVVTSPTRSPIKPADSRKLTSRNKLTKEQPSTSSKTSVRVPPELAHLNVDVAPPRPVTRPAPPSRPSREGTADLVDVQRPSPVVQSELPRLITSYHKRTPSQDTPSSAGSQSFRSRLGLSKSSSSRHGSPRVDSAVSASSLTRTYTGGSMPDLSSSDERQLSRKDSPALDRGTSPAKSQRFGFFSRKSKSEGAKVLEKPKRQPTKGPVAGTGHEGYGRFGFRGRSGSIASSTGVRSPSADSVASGAPAQVSSTRKSSVNSKTSMEMDAFLKERLNPVVLRGSGTGSTISSSTFSSDLPGTSLRHTSTTSSPRDSYMRPSLLPSAMQKSSSSLASRRPTLDRSMSSDVSDDDMGSLYHTTTGTRRSSMRLSQISNTSSLQGRAAMQMQKHPRKPQKSSSIDSYNDAQSVSSVSESPFISETGSHDKEGFWLRSGSTEPVRKPTRKFNFFQRAHTSPNAMSSKKEPSVVKRPEISARSTAAATIAHYAMLESLEPVGFDELERMVQDDIEPSRQSSMSEMSLPAKVVPYEKRHESMLPSPPMPFGRVQLAAQLNPPKINVQRQDDEVAARSARDGSTQQVQQAAMLLPESRPPRTPEVPQIGTPEPTITSTPEQLNANNNSPRPPRLSPIGRIPRVVSKRDRDRKLPDNSFSRPFAQTQPKPSVKPPGSVYTQIREMASPIESGSQPVSTTSTSTRSETNPTDRRSGTFTSLPSTSTARTSIEIGMQPEFLRFTSSRKGSDQSYSTSSDSQTWYSTAHPLPSPQDDIWNEYNDFMDEVMPRKVASINPSQYQGLFYDTQTLPQVLPPLTSAPPTIELPLPPGTAIVPVVLSVPQQIARFLQPSLSPMTPDTLLSFVGGYGDASGSTLLTPTRVSAQYAAQSQSSGIPQPRRPSADSARRASVASSRNSRGSMHSRSSSLPEVKHRSSNASFQETPRARGKQLKDIAEVTTTKPNPVNLRYGALMTSKWLSFGRVLFSPAHNELQLAEDPRVLIVDGLGSDWSFYVAMSYPSASVYNLCPDTPKTPMATWPDPSSKPPRNHFQIPFAGISSPVPFPKGFFNAVVFRFPVVAQEEAYQFFLSECKRVLRPGGFLEVAILDLDLMNMGNQARKAVRDLKTRIQRRDPLICLNNLSDVLIRLIGRRGFDDVQRCVVGVPAVGRIPRSLDMGSSADSDDSDRKSSKKRRETPINEQKFSFADLLSESSSTSNKLSHDQGNDESITKMVAKVGRWWYSSCYEPADQPAGASIWYDRTLLRECERQGTSFRLLICHAQKPTQLRRRTVSL